MSSIRTGTWVLPLLLQVVSGQIAPSDSLLQELTSERYPVRVAAQAELAKWSEESGESGTEWLVRKGIHSPDPELRARSTEVLKDQVLEELSRQRPGFVGITMSSVEVPDQNGGGVGVLVMLVSPGSPADQAGLQRNDIILSVGGHKWDVGEAQDQFARKVGNLKPGTKIQLGVLRKGAPMDFEVTLAPRPWSAGEYGELRANLGARNWDPFAAGQSLPSEAEAREEVFRQWLKAYRNE